MNIDVFAMGFAAAQRAAARVCNDFADELGRHSGGRIEAVRRVRQAASRILDLDPKDARDG